MIDTHVQRLLPRHFKIIDMAVAGHDETAIAKALNLSTSTVKQVLLSPLAQNEIIRKRATDTEAEVMLLDREAYVGKARSILEQAIPKAAQVQVDLLEDENSAMRARAAEKILDRVFAGAPSGTTAVLNITADNVQLLTIALKESKNVDAQVSDCSTADTAF